MVRVVHRRSAAWRFRPRSCTARGPCEPMGSIFPLLFDARSLFPFVFDKYCHRNDQILFSNMPFVIPFMSQADNITTSNLRMRRISTSTELYFPSIALLEILWSKASSRLSVPAISFWPWGWSKRNSAFDQSRDTQHSALHCFLIQNHCSFSVQWAGFLILVLSAYKMIRQDANVIFSLG